MCAFIRSIGTAVPAFQISQRETADFMCRHIAKTEGDRQKINLLYRASGIRSRYTVIPDFGTDPERFTFFPGKEDLQPFPGVGDRMALYEREVSALASEAASACLGQLSTLPQEITHLITVSCTGCVAPGLDIQLIRQFGFDTSVERTSINFMGCYAVFNALKVAANTVKAQPDARVLVVAIELCSIHLQSETTDDALLSGALFGDGAAAVLIESSSSTNALEILRFHNDLALDANDQMSWRIGDFGFEMRLSQHVSETVRKGIGALSARLLEKVGLTSQDIAHFAIHPGGKKILEAIEQALQIDKIKNEHAYTILREYGNMSSPTVLFVLQSLQKSLTFRNHHELILSFAFGPGLTLEGMLLKIHHA